MTATTLENDTDVDNLILLDFDPTLPCEFVTHFNVGCDKKAEWVVRYDCCDFTMVVCTRHKNALINVEEWFSKLTHNPGMGGCGKQMKIVSIEPLG